MRVKTDAKRQEIIEAATELFLELGYQRTSMSLVSKRLGGSKGTLYNYFKSKEELLLAVLEEEVARLSDEVFSEEPGEDLRESLRQMGLRYLRGRLGPRHPRLFRIAASLPEESPVGAAFHRQAIVPANRHTAELIEGLIAKGALRPGDPWTMTMHFKGLLDMDFVERTILSPRDEVSRAEIEKAAWEATDAFLRAYATREEV